MALDLDPGFKTHIFFKLLAVRFQGTQGCLEVQGEPPELEFMGSGCNHEVLGVLGTKNPETQSNLLKKCLFWGSF